MELRHAVLLLASLGLVGCGGIGDLTGGAKPPASLSLLGGAVQATGPDNFCVDGRASRPRDGFALLAPCRLLSGEGPGVPGLALITVQAGDAGTASVAGSEPVFAAFLRSDAGATLLSNTGRSEDITVRQIKARGGIVTAFFDDMGPPAIAGTQPTEWRAFLDVADRLVTISVRGLAEAPLSVSVGDALLGQSISAIVAVNQLDDVAESG